MVLSGLILEDLELILFQKNLNGRSFILFFLEAQPLFCGYSIAFFMLESLIIKKNT